MSINKIQLMGIIGFVMILFGILTTIALKAQSQTETSSQFYERSMQEAKRANDMFSKTSSTEIPIDDGNRIVAVRRIILNYEHLGKIEKMDLVEVELYSKYQIPISNANGDYVFFGERVFIPHISGQKIFVRMKPAEFEEIEDDALVYAAPRPDSLESLRETTAETYKDGEPKEVRGAKFGRLNKALIDKFSAIEEDRESFLKRVN